MPGRSDGIEEGTGALASRGGSRTAHRLRCYELLAEHASDIFLFIRREDARILEANTAAVAAYGYSREELLRLTVFDLRQEATRGATAAQMARADEQGLRFETVHRRKDGTTFPVEVSSVGADDGGRVLVSVVRDISQRREAQERLSRSERRYRLLAENSQDVIWTYDLAARRFTYVSPSVERLRGLTVEEALLEPIERSLTPEALARVQQHLARLAGGEPPAPVTDIFDQPCKDGTIKHVEITVTAILDDGGRPVEVLGVSRDATDRIDAAGALAERERQLEAILELSIDGFWLLDGAGKLLRVNRAAAAISGYSPEELVGMHVGELEAQEEPAEIAARLARLRVAGAERFESRHRRKDGRVVDIEASVQQTSLSGASYACFVRDISKRKRAEQAVRESEARFRALIERSSDMIQLLDAEGRYLFWSQNALQASGWTQDEVLGLPGLALVHEEDAARVGDELGRLLATPGGVGRSTYRLRHKDGSWRRVESVGRNLLDDPAVRGVVVNSRDVTDQHHLEEQLRQAQKLDSVGRLAGGVAHDFNNILTVILGCSDALEEKLRPDDAEGRQDLEEIRAAGGRARDLTRQLLAFARKQVIAPVPLQLNEVIRRSEKLLGRLVGEDVELEVELQPGLWHVRADPGQIDQVLMNLAANARDAMPRGGKLSMATCNRTVAGSGPTQEDELQPGEWVQLRIRDTGTGLSPEVRVHLFEPFYTTKEPGKGTGLGLATVYGIVAQAGGRIDVQSEPGSGACFVISLPRSHESEAPEPVAAPRAPARGTERVLVVEDDPLVRGVIVRALRTEGYRVTAVGHPGEALALPAEDLRATTLLLTDVVMPGLDGPSLARELTRGHPGLRVLYLSGYPRDAMSARGVLEPGAEFMSKPFDRAELLARVRTMLDAGARKA